MALKFITGDREAAAALRQIAGPVGQRMLDAVDMTSVDVRDHAADNHVRNSAHEMGRYENQTTNLSNSIVVIDARPVGGDITGAVVATEGYGVHVELGTRRSRAYPFMIPALEANKKQFLSNIQGALDGNLA